MAIVVNTIQAQPRWAASHVGKKSRVAVTPTVADSDAATTVVSVVSIGGVVAAPLHVEPRLVLKSALFPVSLSMRFSDAAAAALRSPFGQVSLSDEDALATVTKTPVARTLRNASFAIAFGPRGAGLDDEELTEAMIDHAPLWGTQDGVVNAGA